MKNNSASKNILITGASSDIAKSLVDILQKRGCALFLTYRNPPAGSKNGLKTFKLDILKNESFEDFKNEIKDVKFDAVVNFAGAAVTSPVVKLSDEDLKYQFDVVTFGLARLLGAVYPNLKKDSKVINVSSMASFGIFPFISPYCASKAASDIILNAFEIETGIRTVSIKPGVVGTKFWKYCIDLNKDNFKNFDGEYLKTGEFLLENAKNNAKRGVLPEDVAKVIFRAINKKYPKHSYLIGKDAYFASFSRFIPKTVLNFIIRKTLKQRVEKFFNGK